MITRREIKRITTVINDLVFNPPLELKLSLLSFFLRDCFLAEYISYSYRSSAKVEDVRESVSQQA